MYMELMNIKNLGISNILLLTIRITTFYQESNCYYESLEKKV